MANGNGTWEENRKWVLKTIKRLESEMDQVQTTFGGKVEKLVEEIGKMREVIVSVKMRLSWKHAIVAALPGLAALGGILIMLWKAKNGG